MENIIFDRFDYQFIEVGHTFTRATLYKRRKYGPPWTDWELPPVIDRSEPINVTVKEMHAYGKSHKRLGNGITAALVVEGIDSDRNWDWWVFGDQEHESIVHVADLK